MPPRHPGIRRTPLHASLLALLLATVLALAACSTGGAPAEQEGAAAGAGGCIQEFDAGTDYFPEKSELRHAENFTISYHRSYQVLTVKEPYPGGSPESYVLVRCGAPDPELPADLADAPRVEVPVDSLYSSSTTHLPLLADLDMMKVLTGVADASLVVNPEVKQRAEAGEIAEFAPNQQLAVEQVTAAQPDVLLTGGVEDPNYEALRNAGVPVLANAEWLEPTPLGRAEWVKYMAALTGTEARAAQVFDQIESTYQELAASVRDVEPVEVLLGSIVQGAWSMPSGGGYFGRLVKDAGGTYPWADDPAAESLQLDFETVFARGGRARVWIANNPWASLEDARKADPRHTELAAYRQGQVWAIGRAGTDPLGANDFFERGVARPDLVLGDLVAILHPDRKPNHKFVFYNRLR